jgi:hypothetical protein
MREETEKWQENEDVSEVNQVRKIKKWGMHKWFKKTGLKDKRSINSREEWE